MTTILTLALAPTAGLAARGDRSQAHSADSCGGTASLALSDHRPRQTRPVHFSAAGSTVPPAAVAFYDFDYGDGSDDASSLPTAVHAFQDAGTYMTKLSIVTTCNTIVSSSEIRVDVLDGRPPTVTIGFPRANQVAHFGRAGLLLSGTAHDPSGVRRVELAVQLLSVKRSVARSADAGGPARVSASQPGCYWYDGRVALRLRACARALFFAAHVNRGRWSFRMNPRSQIPPGEYTVRARATDRVGNISTVFSPKLGNVLAFGLVA